LDAEDFEAYRINMETFEQQWSLSNYHRFPEIVCTPDTLWGQPRLQGLRLTVADIVSLVDINAAIPIVLNELCSHNKPGTYPSF
jgi:hypothetical protein